MVQWSLLWFSAPTDLNGILGTELKIEKYHEVVNGAIVDAIVKPSGGKRAPKSCMLTSGGRVLQHTQREKNLKIHETMAGERETHTFLF